MADIADNGKAGSSDSAVFTKREIAEHFLTVTKLNAIRKEVRRNTAWQRMYSGWRPDSLTRPVLIQRGINQLSRRGSPEFRDLCSIFLDSLGVPSAADFEGRFRVAAGYTDLDDRTRQVCRYLADRQTPTENLNAPSSDTDGLGTALHNSLQLTSEAPEEPSAIPDAEETSLPSADMSASIALDTHEHEDDTTASTSPTATEDSLLLSAETADPAEPIPWEWVPPDDHVSEAQQAVTTFGRALAAFVQWRLETVYGPRWLRRGCPENMRTKWQHKATESHAVQPATLMGYAEIGEL